MSYPVPHMILTRINEFQAAEDRAEDLFDLLKSLVPYITSSNGCLSCEVLRNKDHHDRFVVIERWESEDAHKKSLADFPKEKMQDAMTLLAAPPSGAFYHI